jgi:hypothetical protein
MQDYQKLYRQRYGKMSKQRRYKEVCRVIESNIKPMAMLVAIILIIKSRS